MDDVLFIYRVGFTVSIAGFVLMYLRSRIMRRMTMIEPIDAFLVRALVCSAMWFIFMPYALYLKIKKR